MPTKYILDNTNIQNKRFKHELNFQPEYIQPSQTEKMISEVKESTRNQVAGVGEDIYGMLSPILPLLREYFCLLGLGLVCWRTRLAGEVLKGRV